MTRETDDDKIEKVLENTPAEVFVFSVEMAALA